VSHNIWKLVEVYNKSILHTAMSVRVSHRTANAAILKDNL